MKSTAILFLGLCFLSPAARAGTPEPAAQFFTEQKIYTDAHYVLNDYLEFSVFDMSRMNLLVNSKPVDLRPAQTPETVARDAAAVASVPPIESRSEREIKSVLADIPKYFYKSLKKQILNSRVPVTLYAADSPAFAKPIQLYVKLKKISLAASETDKKGASIQPIGIKIYGQLKEKTSDKILLRFYDTGTTAFVLGENQAGAAIAAVADDMMGHLADFLKTRY